MQAFSSQSHSSKQKTIRWRLWASQHTVIRGCHDEADHTNNKNNMPNHVAFICDGNSRWAKARKLPTMAGHFVGADRLVEMLSILKEDGVRYCTMFGFSTENWKRPASEVNDIFRVMEQTARKLYPRAIQEQVQIQVIGDVQDNRIPTGLRQILQDLEKDTTTHLRGKTPKLVVCLAINYGGRQDILNASLRLAQAIQAGELHRDEITETTFASFLGTSNTPDPDLIIRTSGECRLSNFLLWDLAYSEIYFTPILWPDFSKDCWKDALTWYQQRKRRFGARHLESEEEPEHITVTPHTESR